MRNRLLGLTVAAALASASWGQGGRGRGAPTAQTPQAPASGARGGRAADTVTPPSGALEFFSFDPTAPAGQPIADGAPAEAHQKITVGGQPFAYTTHAGFLPLRNATTGLTEARLFYTWYAKDGGSASRPIVFFFGGAPGVSAALQEYGGLGPRRIGAGENPHTILADADLVFVNSVGAGFSRPDRPDRASLFWNTGADAASLGAFVRTFLARYERAASPILLAGDDAGSGRVAGVAAYLYDHQVPVHGVALFSLHPSADALAGDAQYLNLLPSLVMTAWHHKKLAPELNAMPSEQIAGMARQFASRDYLHALYNGDRMTAEQRAKVVANLARLTGLSKAFVVNNDLRIPLDRFNAEIFREQGRGVSSSDSRVSGFVPRPAAAGRGFALALAAAPIDFRLSDLSAKFAPAYDAYLRRELGFAGAKDSIFYLTSGGVGPFTSTGNDDATLANAFARNPELRLFVALNYFDLGAPFYAEEYTLAHLNVSPEVRAKNITVTHLEAGGMPYTDPNALGRLHDGLAAFIRATAARQ